MWVQTYLFLEATHFADFKYIVEKYYYVIFLKIRPNFGFNKMSFMTLLNKTVVK